MRITSYHDPDLEVFGHNYALNATVDLGEEATAEDCINAFTRIMQLEGYTNRTLIAAFINVVSDIAEDNVLDDYLKEKLEEEMDAWCF